MVASLSARLCEGCDTETFATDFLNAGGLVKGIYSALNPVGGRQTCRHEVSTTTTMTQEHSNSNVSQSPGLPNEVPVPLEGPYGHVEPIKMEEQPIMGREHTQVAGTIEGDVPQAQESPGPPTPSVVGVQAVKIEEDSAGMAHEWSDLDWTPEDDDTSNAGHENVNPSPALASTSHLISPAFQADTLASRESSDSSFHPDGLSHSESPDSDVPEREFLDIETPGSRFLSNLPGKSAVPSDRSAGSGLTMSVPASFPPGVIEGDTTSRKRNADDFAPGDNGQLPKQRKISNSDSAAGAIFATDQSSHAGSSTNSHVSIGWPNEPFPRTIARGWRNSAKMNAADNGKFVFYQPSSPILSGSPISSEWLNRPLPRLRGRARKHLVQANAAVNSRILSGSPISSEWHDRPLPEYRRGRPWKHPGEAHAAVEDKIGEPPAKDANNGRQGSQKDISSSSLRREIPSKPPALLNPSPIVMANERRRYDQFEGMFVNQSIYSTLFVTSVNEK